MVISYMECSSSVLQDPDSLLHALELFGGGLSCTAAAAQTALLEP